LVGYFGEQLQNCSGCDRCGNRFSGEPLSGEVRLRLNRLRCALSRRPTLWGGCPLEPEVLLRLARHPPADAASLADVPGVGPELTARLGLLILNALALGNDQPTSGTPAKSLPLEVTLRKWRADVARQMGVPPYLVIQDSAVRDIARCRPRSRNELALISGVGPRALAKFGDDLLGITSGEGLTPA
ncbi:MAG TPA: HRDC domain-containing protein, partial [Gemmatimonadales bacterium]